MSLSYSVSLVKPSISTEAVIKWVDIVGIDIRKKTANEIHGTIKIRCKPKLGQRVWVEVFAWFREGGGVGVGAGLVRWLPPFVIMPWDFGWKTDLTMYKWQAKVGVEVARFIGRRTTDIYDFDP